MNCFGFALALLSGITYLFLGIFTDAPFVSITLGWMLGVLFMSGIRLFLDSAAK